MSVVGLIASILFLAGMFILLRRIERWLHQHVFKVGWLSTHNYQTTTILYYTFFMPGVILHEVIYYLAAGILNVRAERQIKWPDEQEVGELKLNFIKLAPRTSAFRKAIITSAPLLVGLVCVWAISHYIFDITAVVERMSSGELSDVGAGFNLLLSAPLFWLWIYVIFTIANTMFPTVPKDLRGWRSVLIGLTVVATALFLVGIGGELFEVLQTPLNTIILVLSQTFVLLICIDLLMVLILGLIEYTIERVTGHSATFRGNRMVTMTREEAIEEREKDRERERKKAEREQRRKENISSAPISVYSLAFVIPGAPGEETVTRLESLPQVEEIPAEATVEEQQSTSMPLFGGLAHDSKEQIKETLTEEQKQQRDAISARINLPSSRPSAPESPAKDKAEEKPAASLTSRFNKPDTGDKPVTPSRFGKPASDERDSKDDKPAARSPFRVRSPGQDKADDKPAASLSSRFNKPDTGDKPVTPPRFGKPASDERDSKDDKPAARSPFGVRSPGQDKADDKPAASLSSRFNKPDTGDKPVTTSRFGKPASDERDSKDDKPAARSPFGVRSSGQDKENEKPAASLTSRFNKPDTDDKPVTTSRFGTQSRFNKPDTGDKPVTPSRFGKPASDDTDKDDKPAARSPFGVRSPGQDKENEKPAASLTARFGQKPKTEEDKETIPAPVDDETIRVVGRPASPGLLDDDDDESLDEAIARRGRGDDGISSLFGQLRGDDDDETDDGDDSIGGFLSPRPSGDSRFGTLSGDKDSDDVSKGSRSDSPFRRGTSPLSPTPSDDDDKTDDGDDSIGASSRFRSSSRFGSSRPAPKPMLSDDDDDSDNDDESVSSLGSYRRSTLLTSRFGSSRPAPKPTFSVGGDEEKDDDLLEDEMVYEDIEDEYLYDDDEEYVEYDDDDEYYDDED